MISNSGKLAEPVYAFDAPLGKARGGMNKLLEEDRPAHDWYRFVLSYPPHLVRHYLQEFKIGAGQVVLDPFCGTGTTLVECKKLGIAGVGIEANDLAFFASAVKVDWGIDPKGLLKDAQAIERKAGIKLEAQGIDAFVPHGQLVEGSSDDRTN